MKKLYFLLFILFSFIIVDAQVVNIPDATFKSRLVNSTVLNQRAKDLLGNYFAIDSNADGQIQVSEALQVSYININQNDGSGIYSLVGINEFSNLNYFSCSDANLYSLDIHGLQYLETINVIYSNIDVVEFYNLPMLKNLSIWYNNLTELDLSNIPSLLSLNCYQNDLTSLDLSMLTNLNTLTCNNNQLVSINMKNGRNQIIQNGLIQGFVGNPTLRFICVDESESAYIQNLVSSIEGSELVVINDYCTFVPGGEYFTINGNVKNDLNFNGCEVSDINYPGLKFTINNGATSGSFYSNELGFYSFPIQAGVHTITPVFDNPTYFSVSPTTVVVDFPTQTSPFTQNFCVTANGIHPDLEVILIAIVPARPGFDATYKLIYKNKGTNIQSGTLHLTFDDTVLDFVSASLVVTNQTLNNLSWNFTNLQPFETREITLTLNVNSPMETPAVNGGDVLNYTATITSLATDETPEDNTFTLNQTVVNSYDPNDKTCLEGTTIAPSEVGKYVHYVIRFENTGTYPAENIVVKDMIDTTKFDVSTLVPIKGSHDFFTRINGNKVEFIFENINLPFDDTNNDGYVAFKIKTKPNLVNGDTFSNSASIYFDYNFPIVTNTTTTTVQTLNTQQFYIDDAFILYPNPANDVLQIVARENITITSIAIYNVMGQLILNIPNRQQSNMINVSELAAGNYLMKIHSSKGISRTKFIKQ